MSLRVRWQRMHMAVLTYTAKAQESPALFQDGRELGNLVALFGMRNTEPYTNKKITIVYEGQRFSHQWEGTITFFCLFLFYSKMPVRTRL